MKAARTAVNFGVLPGIGWGYIHAASMLEDEFQGTQTFSGERMLLDSFTDVLRAQYEYLTGYNYRSMDSLKFLDLTTGEEEDRPSKVYDNAAATCLALEAGWATAKTLSKLSTIQGRGNTNYLNK